MGVFPFFDKQIQVPRIERVRHELKARTVQVRNIEHLTPGMLRITFSGEGLSDFVSLAPDDHVKIVVPALAGENVRRDYTPRRHDPSARTLAIDFAIHDAGPATRWALDAKPGDVLQIGGPKGSAVVTADIRRWLLIGDETALPAIGRRIEEAKAGTRITSIVSVTGPREHQTFETAAHLTTLWNHRPLQAASEPGSLLAMVKTVDLEPETFVWVAAEANVARSIRSHFVKETQLARGWLKVAGYWIAGRSDAHEKFD